MKKAEPTCSLCNGVRVVRVVYRNHMELHRPNIDRQQPCPECAGGKPIEEKEWPHTGRQLHIEPSGGGDPQFARAMLNGWQPLGWLNVC